MDIPTYKRKKASASDAKGAYQRKSNGGTSGAAAKTAYKRKKYDANVPKMVKRLRSRLKGVD